MDNVVIESKFREITRGRVPQSLVEYCIYSYQFNDPCHDVNHLYGVLRNADELGRKSKLDGRDTSCLLASALLHDIGCKYNRKDHHIIAYGMTFDLIDRYGENYYTADEILTIAQACMEHRSSGDGNYSSQISELLALADRGKPELYRYVMAAVLFRLKRFDHHDDKISDIKKHILEKFSKEGYCWKTYPILGFEFYKEEIEILQNQIETIDLDKYIHEVYWEVMKRS